MSPTPKDAKVNYMRIERRLRPLLIGAALLNTILIPCAGHKMLFGLIPTEISLCVNSLLIIFPRTFSSIALRLCVDLVFATGFIAWFVLANVILNETYPWRWRGSTGIIVGTWSSFVTLAMFVITAALCLRSLLQIAIAIHQARENAKTTASDGYSSIGCAQCEHCRAVNAGLTARDCPSPPVHQVSTIVDGLRQWAAGYASVPSAEQYHDEPHEDGKIRLSEDVDADSRERVADNTQGTETRKGRDDEEGF